jgi:hypothetical protein
VLRSAAPIQKSFARLSLIELEARGFEQHDTAHGSENQPNNPETIIGGH